MSLLSLSCNLTLPMNQLYKKYLNKINTKANNAFEPILDELLQLSVWQHVVVIDPIVPGVQDVAHDWTVLETPMTDVTTFYKYLKKFNSNQNPNFN